MRATYQKKKQRQRSKQEVYARTLCVCGCMRGFHVMGVGECRSAPDLGCGCIKFEEQRAP